MIQFQFVVEWPKKNQMFLTIANKARYPYKYTTRASIIDDRDDSSSPRIDNIHPC